VPSELTSQVGIEGIPEARFCRDFIRPIYFTWIDPHGKVQAIFSFHFAQDLGTELVNRLLAAIPSIAKTAQIVYHNRLQALIKSMRNCHDENLHPMRYLKRKSSL